MVYLIFYQQAIHPININSTCQALSNDINKAKNLLYTSLLKQNKQDGQDYHGIVISYPEDTIIDLNQLTHKTIEGYTCSKGICQYSINIPITRKLEPSNQPNTSQLLINLQKSKINHGCNIS